MANRKDWIYLGKQFRKLQKTCRIHVTYYANARDGNHGPRVDGVDGEWDLRGGWKPFVDTKACEEDAPAFERLATAAAVAAGYPEHPNAYVYWLEGIRANDLSEVEDRKRNRTSEALEDRNLEYSAICKTSADYCRLIAAGAAKPPLVAQGAKNRIEGTPDSNLSKGDRSSWSKVKFQLTSDRQAQVWVGENNLGAFNYSEMGFRDGRTGNPKGAWKQFADIAEVQGKLTLPPRSKERNAAESRVKELRKGLQKFLEKQGYFFVDEPLPIKKWTVESVFSTDTGPSYGCVVCGIVDPEFVERAQGDKLKGHSERQVAKYFEEQGFNVTELQVQRHFGHVSKGTV